MYILNVADKVFLSKRATKDIRIVPKFIAVKLQAWVDLVENSGLSEARKIPGFHDEPLKGKRAGQRSIRLSIAYRAIYTTLKDGQYEIVTIEEVNKHVY